MVDNFGNSAIQLDSPARNSETITPDDDNDLDHTTRALWVGSLGDIEVLLVNDTVSTIFTNIPSGTLMPLCVKRVLAGSTTASDIVGIW